MAAPNTSATGEGVADFLDAVPKERRGADATQMDEINQRLTGYKGEVWGSVSVG